MYIIQKISSIEIKKTFRLGKRESITNQLVVMKSLLSLSFSTKKEKRKIDKK